MRQLSVAVFSACIGFFGIACSDADDKPGGVEALPSGGSGGAVAGSGGSAGGPGNGGGRGQGGDDGARPDGGAPPDGGGGEVPGAEVVLEVGGGSDSGCTTRWGQGEKLPCLMSAIYHPSIDTTLLTISDGKAVLAAFYLRGPLQVRSYDKASLLRVVGVQRNGKDLDASKFDLQVLEADARPGPFADGDTIYKFSLKLFVTFGS